MNFAVAMLFSSSYSINSELSVPRYAPLRTMSPVGDTRQENMTAPSFCPFLINSAASMVLITEFGPYPINAGRNSGNAVVGVGVGAGVGVGDAVFCVLDDASSMPRCNLIAQQITNRIAEKAS